MEFVIVRVDKDGPKGHRHHTSDVETAADIIYGLTGEVGDYNRMISVLNGMKNKDIFLADGFAVTCTEKGE